MKTWQVSPDVELQVVDVRMIYWIHSHLVRSEEPGKVAPEGKTTCEACPQSEYTLAPHNLPNGIYGSLVLPVGDGPLRLHLQLDCDMNT